MPYIQRVSLPGGAPAALTYAQEVLADTPAAYYRTNEASGNLQDSSGNGRHLTSLSNITYAQPGLLTTGSDTCIAFSADGYAALSSYQPNTPPFTIEALVKPSNVSADKRFAGAGNSWGAGVSSGGKWLFTTYGLKDYTFAAGPTINTAYLVEFVFTAAQDVDLYINGVFSETVLGTQNPGGFGSDGFAIGARAAPGSAQEFWRGSIDEVAFYTFALSAGRIAAHNAAR